MAESRRLPHIRLGAVIAIGIAAGLGVWLGTRDDGHSSSPPSGTTAAGPTGKRVVPITASGLQTLANALHRPIYWAGEQSGKKYELAQSPNGNVYVRYLAPGASIGTSQAFLTVGTYPVADAFAVTQRSAEQKGSVRIPARGAVAFYNTSAPTSVYLAFPGTDYQVEVYDPSAAEAKQLVGSGKIVPVSTVGAPALVTAVKLKTVAASIGHPIYWVGYRGGVGYELRQDVGDKTYVRYLPRGMTAGASIPALTIGSYGVSDAFSVTQRLASGAGAVQVPVTGGGIAFYSKSAPTSVYVAYPGTNVQIEVYDPSPGLAKQLVSSGKIVPVG